MRGIFRRASSVVSTLFSFPRSYISSSSLWLHALSKMLWTSVIAGGAVFAGIANAQHDGDVSPPSYPSPWMRGGNGWQDAYAKAQNFVSQLTLLEKVNLTTGVGWEGEACVGNTGSIPRLNFTGFCLQDSPLGVRFSTCKRTSVGCISILIV